MQSDFTYYSDVRKITAFETSISVAVLANGIVFFTLFLRASDSGSESPANLYKFVSTKEGDTAFTLIPNGANSIAEDFVSISTPALVMQ